MGPSGSGKSTLLQCLAGLESCTSGSTRIGETDLTRLNDRRLTRLRRDHVGFIFQAFHLIPTLTVLENITLPLVLAGLTPDRQWLHTVIDAAGLGRRLDHRPAQLSGGQQQRAACARALAGRPGSSSSTSRLATWTPAPPPRSSPCCAIASASWARPS